MNGHWMSSRLKWIARLTGVLVILALLFLAGVWLTPPPAPVYALQPPAQPASVSAVITTGVKGTIAAYAALFPQILHINLPLVVR
ncbi:MAG TPA: hypothetical protein PJ988_23140 [Anaerolinea sp.]|nr:hypothetical protein [Anaerolinea sp.]